MGEILEDLRDIGHYLFGYSSEENEAMEEGRRFGVWEDAFRKIPAQIPIRTIPEKEKNKEGSTVPVVYGQVKVQGLTIWIGNLQLSQFVQKIRRFFDALSAYLCSPWQVICMGKVTLIGVQVYDKWLIEQSLTVSGDYDLAYFNDGTQEYNPGNTMNNAVIFIIGTEGFGSIANKLFYSQFGTRWDLCTRNVPVTDIESLGIVALAASPKIFIAIQLFLESGPGTYYSHVYTSSNGINYTTGSVSPVRLESLRIRDIIYGNDLFVAVGGSSGVYGQYYTAPGNDVRTWTLKKLASTPPHVAIYKISYSSDLTLYVAVGTALLPDTLAGVIYTSPTAADSSWTARTSGVAYKLNNITRGGGVFIAVGDHGTILYSANGTSWAAKTSGTTADLYGIVYNSTDGIFLAVGASGKYCLSTDGGLNWSTGTTGTTDLNIAIYNATRNYIVIGGAAGKIMIYNRHPSPAVTSQTIGTSDITSMLNNEYADFPYSSKLKGIAHIYYPEKSSDLILPDKRLVCTTDNKLPPVKYVVRNSLTTSPLTSKIVALDDFIGDNPAAVIYDILTNKQYGLGIDSSKIDTDSFNEVGDSFDPILNPVAMASNRLYGLNILWDTLSSARDLIDKIQDTTDIFLYEEDDIFYLRRMYSDSARIVATLTNDMYSSFSYSKQSYKDLPNEFEGEYIDMRNNYEKKTIVIKNDAAIAMNGGRVIRKKIDLSFFINREVASARLYEIMQRESYPRDSISATVNIKSYQLRPGDLVRVINTEYAIDGNYRVAKVDTGDIDSMDISLELQQAFEELWDGNSQSIDYSKGVIPQRNTDDETGGYAPAADYQALAEKDQPDGYAGLDSNGLIDPTELPPLAIVDFLGTVASEALMLGLTGERGDWCIRSDTSTVFIIIGDDPSQISSWQEIAYPAFSGVIADSPLGGNGTPASHLTVDLSSKPTKVNPSVDGNFVAFNGITGDQKDSGKRASDFLTTESDPKFLAAAIATAHYSGWPNRTDSTLTWVDGTLTLTLTGTFDVWINGLKYTPTAGNKAKTIANVTGLYWFWYALDAGVPKLYAQAAPPGFDKCLTATVYWNAATGKGYMADERHWMGRDQKYHEYLHDTIGCRYGSGLAGTFAVGSFSILTGEVFDEDLSHIISGTQALCNVFYKNGTDDWVWDVDASIIYKVNGTSLRYNTGNTLADVPNANHVAMWVFATNHVARQILVIIGQRVDVNIADARANNTPESLSYGTLPLAEMKLLYRVIFKQDSGSFTYIETADYRSTNAVPNSSFVTTDHAALTNLPYANSGHSGFASRAFAFFSG